tara:strand:+ start:1206 stop:1619 length:414 start_codon:yes stop_codon:yes gene_type:complete
MLINKNNSKEEIYSATVLLLSISKADDIIDHQELKLINNVIVDFFDLTPDNAKEIINNSIKLLDNSTDLYNFGKQLNQSFSYNDKVDFICCAFEVGYCDKNLHFREDYFIRKISNVLNVEHSDLIAAKAEIKEYLKL